MNSLHTLAWCPEPTVTPAPAATPAQAAQRIADEIANTYPSFQLRGLDWDQIIARHRPAVVAAGPASFRGLAAAWVAELGDAHTRVRSTGARFNPPYRGVLTDQGVALLTVPPDSSAATAGVQQGWTVEVSNRLDILRATGASPNIGDKSQHGAP